MDTISQPVQSKAGKLSWSNMALKRCTSTEHIWNRKLVSLTSPVCSEIYYYYYYYHCRHHHHHHHRKCLLVTCLAAMCEVPRWNRLSWVVHLSRKALRYIRGHGLHTLAAVDGSLVTHLSSLLGKVKWVSAFVLSNTKCRWRVWTNWASTAAW